MPKMTVLEMVQDILSDMDSDEVNSISDTVESMQVAQVIKTTFYEIIDGVDVWPHLETLVQLEGLGLTAKPTHMQLPETLSFIEWIKYNKRTATDTKDKYTTVAYKSPSDFMDYLNLRDSSASTTTVVTDFSSVSLNIRNDYAPTYWTSFDDDYIVFDSHDSAVDTTLIASKTQAHGPRDVSLTLTDGAVPDLPSNAFSYLLAEAKSTCFNTLKQSANAKEEQKSKRQRYRLSNTKHRIDRSIEFAGYGRRGRK